MRLDQRLMNLDRRIDGGNELLMSLDRWLDEVARQQELERQ